MGRQRGTLQPPPLRKHRRALHLISQATWDVGNAERCISLRIRGITYIDSSHDKSNCFQHKIRLPLGGNAVTLVTDEGEFNEFYPSSFPSSVNPLPPSPPRGRLYAVVAIYLFLHNGKGFIRFKFSARADKCREYRPYGDRARGNAPAN